MYCVEFIDSLLTYAAHSMRYAPPLHTLRTLIPSTVNHQPTTLHKGASSWNMIDHGVNNAMSTKSPAVQYRFNKDRTVALARAKTKRHQQMRYHGQPYGMFSAGRKSPVATNNLLEDTDAAALCFC